MGREKSKLAIGVVLAVGAWVLGPRVYDAIDPSDWLARKVVIVLVFAAISLGLSLALASLAGSLSQREPRR